MTPAAARLQQAGAAAPLARETHRPQLDGLRAIAVALVVVQHYLPATERYVELGAIGVRVFFVLSGFLITGILLKARARAAATDWPRRKVLLRFYLRRLVRIFPLFYLVLFVTALTGSRPVREDFWWHFGYLSNVRFFVRGVGNDSASHLWSLAVEEQFYLFWPFVLLFVPRKSLLPVLVGAVAIGPLFRGAVLLWGGNAWQASVLTPACLDMLCMGALLAALMQPQYEELRGRFLRVCLWIGPALCLAVIVAGAVHRSRWLALPLGSSIGLWAAPLIYGANRGFSGATGWLLSRRPLTYLGEISYGIYLIHNFAAGFVDRLLRLAPAHLVSPPGRLVCMAAVTLVLASASWFFFEEPINRLKKFFPYVGRPAI